MNDQAVCLKVLRIFGMSKPQEEILLKVNPFLNPIHLLLSNRNIRIYAMKRSCGQLYHENIVPFLGVNFDYFKPKFCLIAPWMKNGNIIDYLELHPIHNRVKCVCSPHCHCSAGCSYIHL